MEMLQPLPKKIYDARVPYIATFTEYELQHQNINVDVVDGKVKDDSCLEFITVMINIDKMIDIFSRGFTIYIIKQSDVTEIYNTLSDYIKRQHPNQQYILNAPKVIENRMYEIEKFLEEIFTINKHTIVKETINVDHGFNVTGGLMQYKSNAGFASPNIQTSMVQNNIPEVDISKVKRIKNTFRETYN